MTASAFMYGAFASSARGIVKPDNNALFLSAAAYFLLR